MGGRILDPPDEPTKVVAELNDRIAADDRVEVAMLELRRRRHSRSQAMSRADAEWRRLIRSGQPPAWKLLAEGSGGRVWEQGGTLAAVVPAAPDRSVFNSVFYEEGERLLGSLEEIAAEYERAGVRAWTVWVPESDTETAAALEAAGHKLRRRAARDGHGALGAARTRDRSGPQDQRTRGLRRDGSAQRDRLRLPARRLPGGGGVGHARVADLFRASSRASRWRRWRSGRATPTPW